jgi:hypothetical protein
LTGTKLLGSFIGTGEALKACGKTETYIPHLVLARRLCSLVPAAVSDFALSVN